MYVPDVPLWLTDLVSACMRLTCEAVMTLMACRAALILNHLHVIHKAELFGELIAMPPGNMQGHCNRQIAT